MDHLPESTPKGELDHRIRNLQEHLLEKRIEAALILQNIDLFYFAGTVAQGCLYIPAEGEPLLMVQKSFERAAGESALARIHAIDSTRQVPDLIAREGYPSPAVLGLECDVVPAGIYFGIERLFKNTKIVDVSPLIRTVRAVKSPYEIEIVRSAARLSDEIAETLRSLLSEGGTEMELAGEIEAHARKRGHQGIIRMRLWGNELFYGHLMAGPSAAVPGYVASPTGGTGPGPAVAQGAGFGRIRRHEPVLFDYVFAYRGYLADSTRIYALGELPEPLVKGHAAMLDVQALLEREAKAGTRAGDIYALALERADSLGFRDHFMGVGDRRIRFVGHGIGLELDEYPFLAKGQDMELQEGMVVAIEPKLVFPGIGVVGIENTHLVTREGLSRLTRFQDEIVQV